MTKIGSLLAGAALALCATQAQAARTLTLTFDLEGVGDRTVAIGAASLPLRFAQLSYVVEEFTGDPNTFYFPSGTFFRFSGTGLTFQMPSALSAGFDAVGNVCYDASAGPVVGSFTPDASCSTLSYRRLVPGGIGAERFTGTVTRFSIAEGNALGGVAIISLTSAVPEPTSWALMLSGFAVVGYALRRRRAVLATA